MTIKCTCGETVIGLTAPAEQTDIPGRKIRIGDAGVLAMASLGVGQAFLTLLFSGVAKLAIAQEVAGNPEIHSILEQLNDGIGAAEKALRGDSRIVAA